MSTSQRPVTPVTGVILAGGKGRRMSGKDKGLLIVNGHPLIENIVNLFAPQVDELLINANRNINKYEQYGYQVIEDKLSGYQGPLAGMSTGLHYASNQHVVFVPCDTYAIPHNLVTRFLSCMNETKKEICVAHDGKRLHTVYALISKSCTESLDHYLADGKRKAEDWIKSQAYTTTDFSDSAKYFRNLNTPDDFIQIDKL